MMLGRDLKSSSLARTTDNDGATKGDIIEEEEGTCTNPAPCHALENVARPGRSRNWSGRARSAAWAG
uniref:Uncharacterized protein n=1 Tax=Ascaris lumbricoides TaxID=6252 RepID=A0A0M3HMN7_ASCLU